MNTDGHETVSEEAGAPLLKEVFGKDHRALTAFYLGNYLQDVCQTVDPVAYFSASKTAEDAVGSALDSVSSSIENTIDDISSSIYDWFDVDKGGKVHRVLNALKPDLDPFVNQAKKKFKEQLDFLFAPKDGNSRNTEVGDFFKNIFFVIGYFKFVHPTKRGGQNRIKLDNYIKIFGKDEENVAWKERLGSFEQYYPQKHLDRPAILGTRNYAPGKQTPGTPNYLAPGKTNATRSISKKEHLSPDMYSYVRDHIEITAGILAEVDLAFKDAILIGVDEDDYNWNQAIAKLGDAMHRIEDFFAHSNWIELAVTRMSEPTLSKLFPPVSDKHDFVNVAWTKYLKSMKRYYSKPLDDWRDHEEEKHIVTGIFDFQDTLISLAHLGEDALGFKVEDPYAKAYDTKKHIKRGKYVQDVQDTMRHTLDFITNPKEAIEDPKNTVSKNLKEKYGTDYKRLTRPSISRQAAKEVASNTPLLRNAPIEIQEAFFAIIIEGSRLRGGFSLYSSLKETITFLAAPIKWLTSFLPTWLKEKVLDALKFYTKERFYEALGGNRIGHHALLSKDTGNEALFKPMQDCSKAVHWYIVNTLVRWKDSDKREYIDWTELLEYFLRNPTVPDDSSYEHVYIDIPVTIPHKIKKGEQLKSSNKKYSLEDKYKNTALNKPQFSWRSIADANFGTQEMSEKDTKNAINHLLQESGLGIPVSNGNYAFKDGISVLIPQQKVRVKARKSVKQNTSWYEAVIEKDWTVFPGYEDAEAEESILPLEHHHLIKITKDQLDQIILRAKKLCRMTREEYTPEKIK